ncbi:L,D-transpeptidase family protein [Halochromatium glycolicum]|uniref:L,D-TPase catalytic domain-containing protein n=1 Tax=Halochromatium glycolicum TaxID=85075 RepID=A0AAJ0U2M7_9GAMM|nr:L,D-transpeptidase family protein [Halochromatium glycolicum]MBK1704087.1 hypothetical protein [Halochromatium glycolicum]
MISNPASARPLWGILLALGIPLLLTGCAQIPFQTSTNDASEPADVEPELETAVSAETAIPGPQESAEPGQLYEWNGHGRPISHVVIDTEAQRARFYDGPEQVGWTTIASGVSSHPTPRGEFEVIEKVKDKRSNLYGRIYDASGNLHKRNAHARRDSIPSGGKFVGARMPHFMRMTYDGIGMHAGAIPQPGQPASHGCIRLPDEIASSLFAQVDLGTRVTVVGDGPDYGNYAERIQRQREQERQKQVAAASASAASAERQATSRLSSGAANDTAQSRASPGSTRSSQARSQPSDATGDSVLASARRNTAHSDESGSSGSTQAAETAEPSTVEQTPARTEPSDSAVPAPEGPSQLEPSQLEPSQLEPSQLEPSQLTSAQQPAPDKQRRAAEISPAAGGETRATNAQTRDSTASRSASASTSASTSTSAAPPPSSPSNRDVTTDSTNADAELPDDRTDGRSQADPQSGTASGTSQGTGITPSALPDAGQEPAPEPTATGRAEPAASEAPARADSSEPNEAAPVNDAT